MTSTRGDNPAPRPLTREQIWDLFIDELDRQGQAGSAADVVIPASLHPEAPTGKRFGELTRIDIGTLVQIAGGLGRRGDVVKGIWEQTQKKLKTQARQNAAAEKRRAQ